MPKIDLSTTPEGAPLPKRNKATVQALLLAINQGIRVFPCYSTRDGVCECPNGRTCHSPGKHPLTKRGVHEATIDRKTIDQWASKWGSRCNWGQALDGRAVADIDVWDGKEGEKTWKEICDRRNVPIDPDTYTIRTGRGGLQFVFTWEEGKDLPVKLGKDIDIKRGSGSYIMVPGSVTIDEYTVLRDPPAATLPPWLADEALAYKKGSGKSVAKPTRTGASTHVFTRAEAAAYLDAGIEPFNASVNGSIDVDANNAFALIWHFIGNYFNADEAMAYFRGNAPDGMIDDHFDKFDRQAHDPEYRLKTDPWKATIVEVSLADARGCNEDANARRLVAKFGNELRYSTSTKWLTWDGARWAPDKLDTVVQYTKEVARGIYGEAERAGSEDEQKSLARWAMKSRSANAIFSTVRLAQSEPEIRVATEALDANPLLFNTRTGTLNLKTGAMQPHRHADLITKMSACDLDLTAESAVWTKFLEWCQPDPEVRGWLQRLFGMALLGEVRDHVMPIFIGDGGNGKGTLRDALVYAFGEYAISVGPELLMQTKHQQHKAYKMRLRGARLVFTSETEEGTRFNESEMKALTGGDPVEGQWMRENPEEFKPSHTLILLTNKEPQINGADFALTRRIRVVPFDAQISTAEMDVELPEKLKAAAPAILRWAWEGWLAYQKNGSLGDAPAAIAERTATYFEEADVLAAFLNTACQRGVGPKFTALSSELHRAFREWAGEDEAGSAMAFNKRMRRHGYRTEKTRLGAVWQGVRVEGIQDIYNHGASQQTSL